MFKVDTDLLVRQRRPFRPVVNASIQHARHAHTIKQKYTVGKAISNGSMRANNESLQEPIKFPDVGKFQQ